MSTQDVTAQIAALRKKREELLTRKMEKAARLKSSKEELRRLSEEAAEHGWDLKELPQVLEQTREQLRAELAEFTQKLDAAEAALDGYEV